MPSKNKLLLLCNKIWNTHISVNVDYIYFTRYMSIKCGLVIIVIAFAKDAQDICLASLIFAFLNCAWDILLFGTRGCGEMHQSMLGPMVKQHDA